MDDLPPLFAPGQRLGRYELLQRLAVGGMAEVYLAYASGPGDFRKVVAIKRLLPQHALDPQLLRMFLDEARLMARLGHPNIPHVNDVDDGDVPYFVMEYVHGTDLRGILNAAEGALPIETALTIAMAVAAGLHHAHEHRGSAGQRLEIVHRDVSPSNVLISFDGGVKVTDFGVAKWAEQKSFTHQGQLKGKFAHMSPEQCRGEALDRRSDVFALGTLIYEMTTGAPPFVAESEYELLTQIVQKDAPPPLRAGEEYPPELSAIVMRSLSRAREDRQPTAQDLQLQLEAFAREHRLVVSPVALAEYLEALFGARVTEWREALKSGQTLADHLAKQSGRSPAATGEDGGGAGRGDERPDRTATDVFTLGSGDGSPAAVPAAAPTSIERRPGGLGRVVAVVVASAITLTLLLVATEATSRWQRASRNTLPTTPALVPPPAATAPAPTTTAVRAPAPVAPGVTAIDGSDSRPGAAVTHRGRDAAAPVRTARRDGAGGGRRTQAPAAGGATTGSAEHARRSPSGPGAAGAANDDVSPPPAPGPAAPAARTGPSTPPPTAPVKVWDPDSPVPP